MGKFTSQGKSYGTPPSRWAMAGSSAGQSLVDSINKRQDQQAQVELMKKQNEITRGNIDEDMMRKAFVQAVNAGTAGRYNWPENIVPPGFVNPDQAGALTYEEDYKKAQTEKIRYGLSPEGQMRNYLQEFTADPNNVQGAQWEYEDRIGAGENVNMSDILKNRAMGSYQAALLAEQALTQTGGTDKFNKAKTPKEQKIALAEAIFQENPEMTREQVRDAVNAVYPALKKIQNNRQMFRKK